MTPSGPAQRRWDKPRALSWSLTGGARLSVVFHLPWRRRTPNRSCWHRLISWSPENPTRTRPIEAINRSHRSSSFRFSSKPWVPPWKIEV
jgi:hypothetical protein